MKNQSVPPSGKETVDALANEWGKLLAIVMMKLGTDHMIVTESDIDKAGADGKLERCIVVQELSDGLHIRVMEIADAQKMAQQNKGGFGRS